MKGNNDKLTENEIANSLYNDISDLIEQSHGRVALKINQEVALLYCRIGRTIRTHISKNKRADYGEVLLSPVHTAS